MYAGAGSCGECAAEGVPGAPHTSIWGACGCRNRGYASTDALSDASRTTPRYSFSSPGFGVAGDAGGGGAGGGGGEKGEDGDGGGGGGGASSAGYLTRAQL